MMMQFARLNIWPLALFAVLSFVLAAILVPLGAYTAAALLFVSGSWFAVSVVVFRDYNTWMQSMEEDLRDAIEGEPGSEELGQVYPLEAVPETHTELDPLV